MRRALLLLPLTALLLPLVPAAAAPNCYGTTPSDLCGGRVVAEPQESTTFQQYDGPVESLQQSLEAIEQLAPRYVEVGPISEFTGAVPEQQSFGKRRLWVVRLTDEAVPREGKKQVAASLSVHALEPAGREGGIRWAEDIARAAAALPGTDAPLYAGDVAKPVSQVLAGTEVWLAFLNPDGWAAGDLDSSDPGPGFVRANDRGQDLNRDYPTVGWYDRLTSSRGVAESEPETKAWVQLVDSFPALTTSTDIHGENTTPNEAFSDLIIPAGQWTPKRQAQVGQLSKHMIRTIERSFEKQGVVLNDVFGAAPSGDGMTPRKPANVAASYDIVGYDDSGFMGDWFSQRQDSVHMDVENFLSNIAPNNAFLPLVEQAHVAGVRGILESVAVEALITQDVAPVLAMKRVAYLEDGVRTTSADGVGAGGGAIAGEEQIAYDVSRTAYFEVLEKTLGRPVDGLPIADVPGADLSGYDSVVVPDDATLPAETLAALKAYAQSGGQLVLTDRAVGLADDLGLVAPADLTLNRTDAGHVDFVAPLGDHPYEAGLVGKPSQTYYEVMLGFPSQGRAPNYGITRTAWTAKGGTTVATVGPQGGASPNTAIGSMPLGQGKVVVLGALLPQAIEELKLENGTVVQTPHPFGLADYAVTITGGRVLDNVLAYSRPGSTTSSPSPSATTAVSTSPSPSESPSESTSPSPSPSLSVSPSAEPSVSPSVEPSLSPSPSLTSAAPTEPVTTTAPATTAPPTTPPATTAPATTAPATTAPATTAPPTTAPPTTAPPTTAPPTTAPATTAPPTTTPPVSCVSGPVGLPTPSVRSGSPALVRLGGTPGATVDLYAYTRPSTAYRVVRTVVVPAGGPAEVSLTAPSNTRMYAQQRGCAEGPSSVLTVRSTVSVDARRTGARTYRFSGNSLPLRPEGLALALYRVTDDGREVLTARTRTDPATGRWTLTRRFTGSGTFGFVVRTPQDLTNAAGTSSRRTVVVR